MSQSSNIFCITDHRHETQAVEANILT